MSAFDKWVITIFNTTSPLPHALFFQEDEIRKSLEENARIGEEYQKYFDLEVVMEDQDAAFRTIIQSLDKLANESQWVPLNWVYSWWEERCAQNHIDSDWKVDEIMNEKFTET